MTTPSRALWASVPLTQRDSIRVLSLAPDADLTSGLIRCQFSVIRIGNIKRPSLTQSQSSSNNTKSPPVTPSISRVNSANTTDSTLPSPSPSPSSASANRNAYSALSYVWGTNPPTQTIEINSFPVAIRPSLADALPHIWAHSPHERLWVDAVCIDQENDEEKMHQVSQMNRIYASAEAVHVFLGREDEGSAGPNLVRWAWSFLDLESEAEGGGEGGEFQRLASLARYGNLDDFEPVELPGKLLRFGDCVAGVKDLLHRPWWKRLWTYQELLLAVRCTVNCGPLRMSWSSFCRAVEELDRIRPRPKVWPDEWAQGLENVRSLMRSLQFLSRRAGVMKRLPPILTRLLLASNERRATDPRDRIFGLLGLIDGRQYPGLKPDYTMTVKQVYTKAAQACIVASQTLEVLHCAGLAYRTPPDSNDAQGGMPASPVDMQRAKDRALEARLPSWVPNFNSEACISKLSASYLDLDSASWNASIVADQAAVKLGKPNTEFHLKLRGWVLGYFATSQTGLVLHSIPACQASPTQKNFLLGGGQPTVPATKLAGLLRAHALGTCGCDPYSRGEKDELFHVREGDLPPGARSGDWLCRLDSGNLSSPYVVRPTDVRSEVEFLLVGHAPQMRPKLNVSADQRWIYPAHDTGKKLGSAKTDVVLY